MVVELFAFCKKDPEKDFFYKKQKRERTAGPINYFFCMQKEEIIFGTRPNIKTLIKIIVSCDLPVLS